jgi:hypothetical protein
MNVDPFPNGFPMGEYHTYVAVDPRSFNCFGGRLNQQDSRFKQHKIRFNQDDLEFRQQNLWDFTSANLDKKQQFRES